MKSRIACVLVGFLPVTASGNGAHIFKFLQEIRASYLGGLLTLVDSQSEAKTCLFWLDREFFISHRINHNVRLHTPHTSTSTSACALWRFRYHVIGQTERRLNEGLNEPWSNTEWRCNEWTVVVRITMGSTIQWIWCPFLLCYMEEVSN
jgi:hypothetical protein